MLFLAGSVSANELQAGDQFTGIEVRGTIQVRCNENGFSTNAYFRCAESLISPTWRSRFISDADADKVKLTYTDFRGRTRTKSSSMRDGESKRKFNLWVGSLTQRPLLNYGDNEIAYELTKNGAVVENGTFNVTVDQGPTRTCSHRVYYSRRLDDCRNSYNVCSYYFREMNYCR